MNQTINLKQFGFKLHFQPNTSSKPVSFTIGIVGLLPYIIPPSNTTLVSALYYIKTSSNLLQPVIIEIQHCVNTTNGGLTFAKATTESDPSSPYVFKKLSGGRFNRKYWGTIKLSNLCFVGIFNEGENSSCDYLLHLSRLRRNHEPSVYQVVLTASLGLNVHKEVIQNRNSDWVPILYNPAPFVFNNRSRALILSIDKDGIQSGNWEINPIVMPPQIEKSAVHCFGMASYELIVSWKNKEEEEIPLRYNMEVQGVNLDYFMIYIDPHEKGPGMVSASVTGGDNREFINLRCTEIEDFKELCHQVADIGDWYGLCLSLGVYDGKLNELKHSNERIGERKRECLQVYFDTGKAYWEEVVRAIIQHPVRKGRVAKKIIEEKNLRSDLLDIINSHAKLICD